MTKSRLFYTGLVLLFTVLFLVFGQFVYLAVLLSLLFVPMVLFILALCAGKGTRFVIRADGEARVGEPCALSIFAANPGALPLPAVELSIEAENVFSGRKSGAVLRQAVEAGGEAQVIWQITPQDCGRTVFRIKRARFYDYFGIYCWSKKNVAACERLVLPPACGCLISFAGQDSPSPESLRYSAAKGGDDPDETHDVREYRPGDRPRSIHWKLTAKTGMMMAREFGLREGEAVLLLAEHGGGIPPGLLNLLSTAFFSISDALLCASISHRAGFYEADGEYSAFRLENSEDEALFQAAFLSSRPAGHPTPGQKEAFLPALASFLSERMQVPLVLYLTAADCSGQLERLADCKTVIFYFSESGQAPERLQTKAAQTGCRLLAVSAQTLEERLYPLTL